MKISAWELEATDDEICSRYQPKGEFIIDDNERSIFELSWIRKLEENKNNPIRRYEIAMDNLPLPRAFRESIIALRFMIRSSIKDNKEYIHFLNRIYKLATWFSFMGNPYCEALKMPSFTIFEQIKGGFITSLKFNYSSIGYEKLTLLGKNDIKLLIKHYGEPKNHTTLNDMYKEEWNNQVLRFQKIYKKRIDEINRGIFINNLTR